jgi:hypothetical protein
MSLPPQYRSAQAKKFFATAFATELDSTGQNGTVWQAWLMVGLGLKYKLNRTRHNGAVRWVQGLQFSCNGPTSRPLAKWPSACAKG